MRVQRQLERQGYLLLITLGAIVVAFMGLSLAITATGTARFAVAMAIARRSAMQSALSSTLPRRCSSNCAVSWRRPRTTSNLMFGQGS